MYKPDKILQEDDCKKLVKLGYFTQKSAMNSVSRYYLEATKWTDNTLILDGVEAHHCVRVLRAKTGDLVEVFDGLGRSAVGNIISMNKQEVHVEISEQKMQAESKCSLHLCQAIPKGGNMEWIVQKAVELGVSEIQPMLTENTVARAEQIEKKQTKWQRTALEACKQCGQNIIPVIHPTISFTEFLKTKQQTNLEVMAALDPRSMPIKEVLRKIKSPVNDARIWVGPEGDFSAQEYDLAHDAGIHFASIGDIVLKVETATLYCLSTLKYEFG